MESAEFRSALKVPFKILKISGNVLTRDASRFYKIAGILFRFISLDLFVLCQVTYVFKANSLLDLSDSLSVCFTYVILWLKAWSYSLNMDKILELLDEIEKLTSLIQTIEKKPLAKLQTRLDQAQLFFRVFWSLCFATTFFGALVPVTTYLVNPTPPYKIPYVMWVPFDYKHELGWFIFVSACEGWNGMFNCGVAAALDVLPILIFNAGAGLLEELGERMRGIGENANGSGQTVISNDDSDHQMENLPQSDLLVEEGSENYHGNLKQLERCIAIHLRIKGFIRKTEETFSFMIFMQGGVSLIILCTSAFLLTKISPSQDFAKFMFTVIYLFPMVLQILLPCYFCNEITLVSGNLSADLFHSKWFKENKQFRTAMKIFIENTKTPMVVSAANGFFHVNLSGFLKILNLTYSVYALLQRLN